jgi:hypothetical protein
MTGSASLEGCTAPGQASSFSRRRLRPSFAKAKFTKSHSHEKPRAFRMERREAPGRGPRHADGCCHPPTLRAWSAPQEIRLREPPASGALRLPALHHHRGSPPRLSTAAARVPLPLRVRPASSTGILTKSGMIRSLTRNLDLLSSIDSYHVETPTPLNLSPRRLSDQ